MHKLSDRSFRSSLLLRFLLTLSIIFMIFLLLSHSKDHNDRMNQMTFEIR